MDSLGLVLCVGVAEARKQMFLNFIKIFNCFDKQRLGLSGEKAAGWLAGTCGNVEWKLKRVQRQRKEREKRLLRSRRWHFR